MKSFHNQNISIFVFLNIKSKERRKKKLKNILLWDQISGWIFQLNYNFMISVNFIRKSIKYLIHFISFYSIRFILFLINCQRKNVSKITNGFPSIGIIIESRPNPLPR